MEIKRAIFIKNQFFGIYTLKRFGKLYWYKEDIKSYRILDIKMANECIRLDLNRPISSGWEAFIDFEEEDLYENTA